MGLRGDIVDKQHHFRLGQNAPESGLNVLSETIYQSSFINTHLDFYRWQQEYVCKFIPHTTLIAAWGKFSEQKIQFDVSSSIPEMHTYQQSSGCMELIPLVTRLFEKWEENGDGWYFQDSFQLSRLNIDFPPGSVMFSELEKMISVLVYGFRDKRSGTEVLYAFFNSKPEYETQTSVLSTLMPHLDTALRRVDCFDNNKVINIFEVITEREVSVMELVIEGKKNTEIAEHLFISVNTVKNHLKNIFKKMKVSSRAEAVAKFLQMNAKETEALPSVRAKAI